MVMQQRGQHALRPSECSVADVIDPSRRSFLRLLGVGSLVSPMLVAGCGRTFDDLSRALEPEVVLDVPQSETIDDVSHVLNRLTFGPRPGDYARVRERTPEAFIEEQLRPEEIDDARCDLKLAGIESIRERRVELFDYSAEELRFDLIRAKLLRAVYSRRQLYEVMVDFWTDHFNIAISKQQCRWLKTADDREVVRKHALGRFSDLVKASARSPAMLVYLDGVRNRFEANGQKPNENYARELLELHTMGVDGGYTQDDVIDVARCLSGWTYRHSLLHPDRVQFVPRFHDDGPKRVLGVDIPAGGGERDLDDVIRIVCSHPSTARFLAGKLARRFVSEDPPNELVESVAATYVATRGDIRSMLRVIFASEAFRDSKGGLFKRPFHFIVSALRATDAYATGGSGVMRVLERMGHLPFEYPTPDGYPLESQPWLGSLMWRWRAGAMLARNNVQGVQVHADRLVREYGSAERFAAAVLGRALHAKEREVLERTDDPLGLLICSPGFQRC